jgi:hypothetical protein
MDYFAETCSISLLPLSNQKHTNVVSCQATRGSGLGIEGIESRFELMDMLATKITPLL